MALDDSTWKILGENVQLEKRSQLLITGERPDKNSKQPQQLPEH